MPEILTFLGAARTRVRETMDLEAERAMFASFDPELVADFFLPDKDKIF